MQRKEFAEPVEAVLETIAPGADKLLPRGGQRFWYFDTRLRFPVLIVTQDASGREVEYYCYDRFLFPCRLLNDEFDPDALWQQ